MSSGFTPRTCDEQRTLSWSLICEGGEGGDKDTPNADLVKKIDSVIKKAVAWGQAANGNNFRLYVTGYGQFFNDKDPGSLKSNSTLALGGWGRQIIHESQSHMNFA